jgi:hypothetical protein
MAGGEQRWAELSARAQDLALPGSERRAVFKELHEAIAAVIRTSEAPTAANKLLDLGVMEWAWVNPYSDIVTYIALGDLQGHADVKDMLTTAFAAIRAGFALFDGWGSHEHPEWRHRVHDGMYAAIKSKVAGFAAEVARGGGIESDDVMARLKVAAQATGAAWNSAETAQGASLCTNLTVLVFGNNPVAMHETIAPAIDCGAWETVATALQEAELCSTGLYLSLIGAV